QMMVLDENTYYTATAPVQAFTLSGDNETLIVGKEGMTLSMPQDRSIVIQSGTAVAFVGSSELNVQTTFGIFTIPANGIALVDNVSSTSVRFVNLSGSPMNMTLFQAGQRSTISIDVSEELVLSTSTKNAIAGQSNDGLARQLLSSTIFGTIHVFKNKLDREQV